MLKYVDRIQLAVPDVAAAADTFTRFFGALPAGEGRLPHLNARKVVVSVGDSEVELLEPTDVGEIQKFIDKTGGGLFAVGFATDDAAEVMTSLLRQGEQITMVGDHIHVAPMEIGGLRTIISPAADDERPRVGLLRHIYEVTNPVVDLKKAVDFYVDTFKLDASKFQPIGSDRYGYTGTLTLFDPPDRLDRIEVTQITDYDGAMGRFHKQRGDSLYMCFAEVDDFDNLRRTLDQAGAQYALDDSQPEGDPDVLFVHPKSLHGMLMGISKTGVAWRWSSGGTYH